MNYLSLIFFGFIPLFLVIYYIVPQKCRYIVIAIGSYIFYGFADFRLLIVLMSVTVLTYIGGLFLQKKKTRAVYALFMILTILILLVFKYTNFTIRNINLILAKFAGETAYQLTSVNFILPVGLSFIVFQACTYLGDVYRDKLNVEKNILRYAAFVAFFPTILSGPIQKARELLPQIKEPMPFDAETAKKGTILFVWGAFEKIMVANKLLVIVNRVFGDYENYNSVYYIIAAVCFSLYIYADFASYSDMARGIAMLMGIRVSKNFNNPYLSCSTAEFWNRWHMSLNAWFIENIYIPLGGNRKGVLRKYINTFIVFFISGLWHGAAYRYIVWGVVNGGLVITGQILKPLKSRIYSAIHVDEEVESIKYLRRVIVFIQITITWIFFNNGVSVSLIILKRIVLLNLINLFDQNLFSISGTLAATFTTAVAALLFVYIQLKRQNESKEYERYSRQPLLFQTAILGILICICVFGACSTDATVNTQFIYFQF